MEIKHCLQPNEIPKKEGSGSLRACGTRFIGHKVLVLGRLIDCLGAYVHQLFKEPHRRLATFRSGERHKCFVGVRNIIIIVKPMLDSCKALQALESILKTSKTLEKVTYFTYISTLQITINNLLT